MYICGGNSPQKALFGGFVNSKVVQLGVCVCGDGVMSFTFMHFAALLAFAYECVSAVGSVHRLRWHT
jgi:hypothetical protein